MKRFGFLLPLAIVCLLCVSLLASTPSQQKSRYYLLQGMQHEVEDNLSAAYELYRHAHSLDPDNKLATYKIGMLDLLRGDSASVAGGLASMREYVEAYPTDYQENLAYATICARLNHNAEAYRVLKRLYSLFPDKTELLNTLAETSMFLEMPDTALHYLDLQEQVDGASPYITNCRIVVLMSKGDTVSVMRETDEALREHPSDPYYYLLKASVLQELVSPDSALCYFKMADSIFPANWDVKNSLLAYYNMTADSVAMERTLYEAMLTEDGELEDKIELFAGYVAPLLAEGKATAHADHLMQTLEEQYPYEPTLRGLAAQYSAAKGDMDKAVDQITIAVDMASDNMEYRTLQVQYLVGAGLYDRAVMAYEAVPATQSAEMPVLSLMAASAYQGAERYNEGLAVVDSLLYNLTYGACPDSLSDNDLKALLNAKGIALFSDAMGERANILFLMDEPERAISSYDKALSIDPDNVMMLNNYAFFMAKAGVNFDKAAEMSLKSVTEEPDNPIYLDTYAYVLFRKGNYDQALEYIEKAIDKAEADNDLSAEYYEHYGDILIKLGQTAKALEMWNKALNIDPSRLILKQKIKTKSYIDE